MRNKPDLFSFGSWRMVLTLGTVEPGSGGVCCSLLCLHKEDIVELFLAFTPPCCPVAVFILCEGIVNAACSFGRF